MGKEQLPVSFENEDRCGTNHKYVINPVSNVPHIAASAKHRLIICSYLAFVLILKCDVRIDISTNHSAAIVLTDNNNRGRLDLGQGPAWGDAENVTTISVQSPIGYVTVSASQQKLYPHLYTLGHTTFSTKPSTPGAAVGRRLFCFIVSRLVQEQ